MGYSQDGSSRDALDHRFGDSAFDGIVGGAAQPTSPDSSPASTPAAAHGAPHGALPSRRELRTAPKGRKRTVTKAPSVPKRGRSRADASREAAPAFVPTVDSAYPANRVIVVRRAPTPLRKKKRGSGFLTILMVVGLFGSVAIPAYAFSPNVGVKSADVSITADDASLTVADSAAASTAARGEFKATTASDLRNQKRTTYTAENFAAYMASGAREKGDDYPWFSELSTSQGGGLSPLNYFYRQCVDFVAWRLNRDAGTTSAPYAWTWSNLTSSGGNASQWRYAWTSKGWPTGTTPVVGAVAWFPYNHVAYVKAVNADGTVLIEEYNWEGKSLYGQRTIPASDVPIYLYQPPR